MESTTEYSQSLQVLMTKANISSIKELSHLSGISEWQLYRLEEGLLLKMEIQLLLKLCEVLQVSPQEMIKKFTPQALLKEDIFIYDQSSEIAQIKKEYGNIKQQLEDQKPMLKQQFQQEALQILETYLIQYPTVVSAIENNPQIPAQRIIPLMKPLEKLLEKWNVQTLETVGAEVPYNPQFHQLMEGIAQVGETVKVRYVGYVQGEKLLYRAKVSPIANH